MKKLFQIGALFLGIFMIQNTYAQCGSGSCAPSCCEQPCDQPTNDCWCKFVHYQPCYYNTYRCYEEQIPCPKKCCRMVPQYYEVQKCRYVPEYYTVTCCRQVPEYYTVEQYRCCKRTICEPQCKYVPRYYWKRVCNNPCGTP